MKQRVISAVVMIAITAVCCTVSVYTKLIFIAAVGVLSCIDFIGAINRSGVKGSPVIPSAAVALAVISMLFGREYFIAVFALAVFAVLIHAVLKADASCAIAELTALAYPAFLITLIALAGSSEIWITVFLISCVSTWICDAFALFGGLLFGKHRLAPKVSPKKSIEGAVSGAVFAVISSVCVYFILKAFENKGLYCPNIAVCMLCGLVGSSLGQFGDLAASVFKRYVGIKDYSNLIPGHGGVLDRLDSLLFSIPTVYIILNFVYSLSR